MTRLNGHLPEGAKVVTLELLRAANTKYVKAPSLSERAGEDVYVQIRAIRRATYLQMLPPPPPGSEAWPVMKPEMSSEEKQKVAEERTKLYTAWLGTLPPEEAAARRREDDYLTYRLLVAGMVEPRIALETAQDLAEDADAIAVEIMRFSGLLDEAPTKPAQAAPAEVSESA